MCPHHLEISLRNFVGYYVTSPDLFGPSVFWLSTSITASLRVSPRHWCLYRTWILLLFSELGFLNVFFFDVSYDNFSRRIQGIYSESILPLLVVFQWFDTIVSKLALCSLAIERREIVSIIWNNLVSLSKFWSDHIWQLDMLCNYCFKEVL